MKEPIDNNDSESHDDMVISPKYETSGSKAISNCDRPHSEDLEGVVGSKDSPTSTCENESAHEASELPKQTSKDARFKKKPLLFAIIGAVVIVIVIVIVLAMTVFSPENKADRLFEQESYAEALKIYDSLASSDSIEAKKSQCRYFMFVEYLQAKGPYKTQESDVGWRIEGYGNGDIKCSVSTNFTEESYVGFQYDIIMTIHYDNTSADLSGSFKMKVLSSIASENASGKLDLPSYTYGKNITWDSYSNTGSTTNSFLKSNSGTIQKIIQTGLKPALNASGTGATLKDLGFKQL